jgi:histone-lysine N-methyltransferase SUV39H
VNDIDDTMPPDSFVYVTTNILGHGVPEPEEGVVIGCSCHGNCSRSKRCCPQMLQDSTFPYTKDGLIKLDPGKAVVECNKKCDCDDSCLSRVVQKGRQIEVCIFRTDNGRGWGLKTLIDIKAKQFVTEYVGEILTADEAEERGKLYDDQGATYLMDLDFNEDKEAEFTIDGKYYGNASRFINHSCSPNLIAYGCWVDNPDIRLPRIGLFAIGDIPAGEELTMDYLMSPMDPNQSSGSRRMCPSPNTPPPTPLNAKKSPQRQRKRVQCKCGSEDCRTVLF